MRIAKSQATTMKIRNRNGLIHAAFSALEMPLSPFGPATLRSLVSWLLLGEELTRWINTVQRVGLRLFGGFHAVMAGLVRATIDVSSWRKPAPIPRNFSVRQAVGRSQP